MKPSVLELLLAVFLFVGCSVMPQVDFVYFNLSGHEITVTDLSGLPRNAQPGVLVAVQDDTNRLNEKSVTFSESVRITDAIKIVWDENGASRTFEARRADLGLPTLLDSGQIRLSYLGDGKWRVRFSRQNI